MSLDEWLFEKYWYKWKAKNSDKEFKVPEGAFELRQVTKRLEITTLAMTGRHFRILLDAGPAYASQDHLILPEFIAQFSENEKNLNLAFHLVVFLGWASQRGYKLEKNLDGLSKNEWKDLSQQLRGPLIDDFYKEYPCFALQRADALAYPEVFFGLAEPRSTGNISQQSQLDIHTQKSLGKKLSELIVKTEKKAKQKKLNSENENPLVHIFEKLLSLDSFQGGDKKLDGSDESSEHQQALSEVKLEYVIRTNETAETTVNSDSAIDGADIEDSTEKMPDPGVKNYFYDEWDYKLQSFRKNWCSLFEHNSLNDEESSNPVMIQAEANSSWIKSYQDKLDWIFNNRQWARRRLVGDEIDLNQVVDHLVSTKVSGQGLARVYCEILRQDLNIGILILVDSSQSTDSVLGDKRWIDHVGQALKYISEIFNQRIDECEISSFYSETRKSCHYQVLKAPQDDWTDIDKKLGGLQSNGYTRIGTALRHAKMRSLQMRSQKQHIILITDSKPSDYDRYEGHYGIRDVHHAVEEIRAAGIHFEALSSKTQISETMSEMFGTNGFQYFSSSENLVEVLINRLIETHRK